jgi:hypothetical protein
MANIQIKRGQETTVDVIYIPTGSSYSTPYYTNDARYTATLKLRRKNGTSVTDDLIDTLASNTSGTGQNTSGRIRFPDIGNTSALRNIQILWTTAESVALPNEAVTMQGDLKITDTDATPDAVIESFRFIFDIVPEIL